MTSPEILNYILQTLYSKLGHISQIPSGHIMGEGGGGIIQSTTYG